MFCANCGTKLEEGANFCTHCGKPVVSNVAEPAKPVEEISEPIPPLPEEEQQNPAAPSPVVETIESAVQPSAEEPAEPAMPLPVEEIPKPKSTPAEVQPVETEERFPAEEFPEPTPQPTMAESEPVISNSTVQQTGSVPASFVQPQRKGLKKLYIVLAAAFVVVVSGGLILKWYTSPAQKFSRAMGQADYVTASNQYGRMSPQEQDTALNQLANMAWDAVQDYSGGGATYEEVDQWLEGLTTSYFPQLEGYAPEIFDMLENLHTAKEHIEKAEAAESGGDLPTALSEYEASLAASNELADDIGPDTEELNAKIQNIEQKYKSEIIEQAKALANQKDYSGAAALLRESQSVLGGDEEIQSLLNEYGDQQTEADVSALLETAETKAKSGDYSGAISDLQGSAVTDSRITSKLAEYKTAYISQTLENAEKAYQDSGDYTEAIKVLQTAIAAVGSEDALIEKVEMYQDYAPVYLADMEYDDRMCVDVGEDYHDDDHMDMQENKYPSERVFSTYSFYGYAETENEGFVQYFLNSKYKTLTGTVYVPYSAHAATNPRVLPLFKVYGDNVLLYEAPPLSNESSDPIRLKIDVSGVRTLKIVMLGVWIKSDGSSWYSPMVCAADLAVSKG